jgi:hypothetical protein
MNRRLHSGVGGLLFLAQLASSGLVATPAHARAMASDVVDYIFSDGFEAPVDCSAALTCPVPQAGKSCLAGRLAAAGSGAQLRAPYKPELTCGTGAGGGPCDLSITVHDVVQWASNPAGSSPLASADVIVDGCGRFRFSGIDPPATGYAAVVVDDAPASGNDLYVPGATFHALGANMLVSGITAVATLHDTVDGWTLSAGAPFGASTFADVGVMLFGFNVGGYPRSGVVVTMSGSVFAANDYYFSDAQPLERYTVDGSLTQTGVDGAALFVNGGLTTYSGTGGEPMGCTWPSVLATTVAGAVVFVEIGC